MASGDPPMASMPMVSTRWAAIGWDSPSMRHSIWRGSATLTGDAFSTISAETPTERITFDTPKEEIRKGIVLAPPSAVGSAWMRRFAPYNFGYCSGWMAIRGAKRRRAADRGFVLSDHADSDDLIATARGTGAITSGTWSAAACGKVTTAAAPPGKTEVARDLQGMGMKLMAHGERVVGRRPRVFRAHAQEVRVDELSHDDARLQVHSTAVVADATRDGDGLRERLPFRA